VLFYKYFSPDVIERLSQNTEQIHDTYRFIKTTAEKFKLRGRILFASEGINGTLSATTKETLVNFVHILEEYQFESTRMCVFLDIDWKYSTTKDDSIAPFPDLYVSLVKEIVNSGGTFDAKDIDQFGGKHLSPEEFHLALSSGSKDTVVIDVRNPYEYAIGHFISAEGEEAIDPCMVTFSSFDSSFCTKNADKLKDKRVLMYCTGGVRCEKASGMLRKRGVNNVCQLKGGIHRYLEAFPDGGFFKGKNFTFDKRVAVSSENKNILGSCLECNEAWDELSGRKICTVCRELVLICNECESNLREYHCIRHSFLKSCYFTFLEVYDIEQLRLMHEELTSIMKESNRAQQSKKLRKTLRKQINRVSARMEMIEEDEACVDCNVPRKCRMCLSSKCDGLCWGFWKP